MGSSAGTWGQTDGETHGEGTEGGTGTEEGDRAGIGVRHGPVGVQHPPPPNSTHIGTHPWGGGTPDPPPTPPSLGLPQEQLPLPPPCPGTGGAAETPKWDTKRWGCPKSWGGAPGGSEPSEFGEGGPQLGGGGGWHSWMDTQTRGAASPFRVVFGGGGPCLREGSPNLGTWGCSGQGVPQ